MRPWLEGADTLPYLDLAHKERLPTAPAPHLSYLNLARRGLQRSLPPPKGGRRSPLVPNIKIMLVLLHDFDPMV